MNNNTGADDRTVIYTGESSPSAKLVCLDIMLDESLHDLDVRLGVQDETIGRGDDNSICIRYNKISRNHARISFAKNQWLIEDLESANGVYINEQRINKAAMGQGDIVVIGQVPFRFEIEQTSPGMAAIIEESPDDYVGDSGTMYAQHVGVIESLASSDEINDDHVDELPPPAFASKQHSGTENTPRASSPQQTYSPDKPKGKKKYLLLLVLIIASIGGAFYWDNNNQKREVEKLHKQFAKDVRQFLENFESNAGTQSSSGTSDSEQNELRQISARVEVALNQNPKHDGLNKLKQQVLFLSFERDLLQQLQNSKYYDADGSIERARSEINAISTNDVKASKNFNGLLDLAEIAVRFNRFSEQYPDPKPNATIAPDEYNLRKMNEVKAQFINKKKANYQLLSVTYSRFHQLLEQIEREDIRLLNRWQEIRKRGS